MSSLADRCGLHDNSSMSQPEQHPNPDMTLELHDLFQVPRQERDEEWLKDFFEVIPTASLRGFDPQIQHGPDGFPYLMLSIPESGEEFDAFCVADAVEYCLKAGCGIVILSQPNKIDQPEWIFPFGSLWAYAKYGNFVGDPSDELPDRTASNPNQQESDNTLSAAQTDENRQVQVGAPSEDYLPSFARAAIGRFLNEAIGLQQPRVALVVDPLLKPSRSLMFAELTPDRFEKEEHFAIVMNSLRWFLPATRGLMVSVPEIEAHSAPL
jgi:hypothetical protein